jgi:hypothetical protein
MLAGPTGLEPAASGVTGINPQPERKGVQQVTAGATLACHGTSGPRIRFRTLPSSSARGDSAFSRVPPRNVRTRSPTSALRPFRFADLAQIIQQGDCDVIVGRALCDNERLDTPRFKLPLLQCAFRLTTESHNPRDVPSVRR